MKKHTRERRRQERLAMEGRQPVEAVENKMDQADPTGFVEPERVTEAATTEKETLFREDASTPPFEEEVIE